jgi:Holliday junction resolvase RusA-like endonuclease
MPRVKLTLPPSTNNLYANYGNRRRKTSQYRSWLEEAGWCLKPCPPMDDRQEWYISIVAIVTRRRDLDNIIKPTVDALVKSGKAPDDRWLDNIVVERKLKRLGGPGDIMEVTWDKC